MIKTKISDIAKIIHAKLIGNNAIISSISTDSRKYKRDCLFLALIGKKFNAHNFVDHAIKYGGCIAVVVNYKINTLVPQLLVNDTKVALIKLAAWIRKVTKVRIIAITGSSGKTSVKEITAKILSQSNVILYTKKNFNNEIGISLTLLELTYAHKFLIIEIGARKLGDIQKFSNVLQSEVALINNLSASHLSSFKSMSILSQTKGEIINSLKNDGTFISNHDSNDLLHWPRINSLKKIILFSEYQKDNIDFFATNKIVNLTGTKFYLHSPYGKHLIYTPLIGMHNIANILASCAISFAIGTKISDILLGLKKISFIPGRMYPIFLAKNKIILDDSYNANPCSMINAIQTLNFMPGYKVIIIGDMLELGNYSITYHKIIGKLISKKKINEVISIGKLSYFTSILNKNGKHFYDAKLLVNYIIKLININEYITLLFKGSRSSNMQKIVKIIKRYFKC